MASETPTIRQTAWVSVIPQFLFMGLLLLVFHQISSENAVLYGAVTYLSISYILRNFIPKSHRKGLSLYNENRFLEGIDSFQKSYDFFCQHNYLDKYRYLLLLSSSKMGYKETALNNIAFGYSQIGDGKKAKEYYERLLVEFPKNGIAKVALKMIDSFEKSE
ncbi:tetratricopeptide repeat protein [Flavobacterium sp.]|uniref:tetratricopeptide repeat protein n=1 Tax=Flavobacterium sp. TaxID=239 RepID=UPI004047EE95